MSKTHQISQIDVHKVHDRYTWFVYGQPEDTQCKWERNKTLLGKEWINPPKAQVSSFANRNVYKNKPTVKSG